jgi:hypothetical protein
LGFVGARMLAWVNRAKKMQIKRIKLHLYVFIYDKIPFLAGFALPFTRQKIPAVV